MWRSWVGSGKWAAMNHDTCPMKHDTCLVSSAPPANMSCSVSHETCPAASLPPFAPVLSFVTLVTACLTYVTLGLEWVSPSGWKPTMAAVCVWMGVLLATCGHVRVSDVWP
jgi:hypothetical protein